MIPPDIALRIASDFPGVNSRAEVTHEIEKLWRTSLNVGPSQLARSILYLAEGRSEEVARLCTGLMGDPRDVVMEAERKAGNPGHYFIEPFDQGSVLGCSRLRVAFSYVQ